MYQKKRFAAGAMALLMALALAAPASAHCGHGRTGARSRTAPIPVCTLEDCTTLGRHTHDGVLYCGSQHEGCVCDGTCLVSTAHHYSGHHRGHCR